MIASHAQHSRGPILPPQEHPETHTALAAHTLSESYNQHSRGPILPPQEHPETHSALAAHTLSESYNLPDSLVHRPEMDTTAEGTFTHHQPPQYLTTD
jgi:hypothetical protein